MATQTTTYVAGTASGASAPRTALMKDYYDRKLLEIAQQVFVYQQFAQKRSIPARSGKTVEFRRWNLFAPSTTTQALTEGVTPSAQDISQTKITATVEQYGAYVEVSDLLDLTAYDPVINDCVTLLAEQIGNVLDMVTRDAMIAGASVQYAGGKTAKTGITATDKMSVTEIRKGVRTLKKAHARRFTGAGKGGHFVCIVDPDVAFDLQSDTLWQDVSKYANPEQIYNGEIGRLFGVVFTETTDGYTEEVGDSTKVNVHHSLLFGADAYGVIDVAGKGGVRSIIKPVGSGGTSDPLDQRSTVGAKVDAFAAKVLNANWIIDIMSAAS